MQSAPSSDCEITGVASNPKPKRLKERKKKYEWKSGLSVDRLERKDRKVSKVVMEIDFRVFNTDAIKSRKIQDGILNIYTREQNNATLKENMTMNLPLLVVVRGDKQFAFM